MPYKIFLDKRMAKSFEKINKKFVNKILEAISELEYFSPKLRNIRKLNTPLNGYRQRVGDYRILFKISKKDIFIYSIKHRKDIYK